MEEQIQTDASGRAPQLESIPVPTGTRDVLPEEMAELRVVTQKMLATFSEAGYGEVATPTLEFEETFRRGGADLLRGAYRIPDKDGRVLTLRFDSTVPIARLAATRYRNVEPPMRFCYVQNVYRAVEPKRAQSRQFLQIGMELLGPDARSGDAEGIELLVRLLRTSGLKDFKVAIGDVSFFAEVLDHCGVDDELRAALLHELHTRDLVGFRRVLAESALETDARTRLERIALARGGGEILAAEGAEALAALDAELTARGVSADVIYDLGLVRELDYYTGTVLEVYAASEGQALGGGGRYDNLVARFGRDLPAFGCSLNVERLHQALLAEQDRA